MVQCALSLTHCEYCGVRLSFIKLNIGLHLHVNIPAPLRIENDGRYRQLDKIIPGNYNINRSALCSGIVAVNKEISSANHSCLISKRFGFGNLVLN